MDNTIHVMIRGKVAEKTCDTVYVCGNSDFVIDFDLDEEWQKRESKIARFIKKDGFYIDVPFAGNQCNVPIISNVHCFYVGLYAGNLYTTTPAYVPARKSILCETGAPEPPTPEVYEQLKQIMADGLDLALAEANKAVRASETAEEARDVAVSNADVAAECAQNARNSETNSAESERKAETYSQLAQQAAAEKGWMYVEGRDNGILYLITSDNAPDDITLKDDGTGRLVAVYG